jgi:hypothetical protein
MRLHCVRMPLQHYPSLLPFDLASLAFAFFVLASLNTVEHSTKKFWDLRNVMRASTVHKRLACDGLISCGGMPCASNSRL